jgi:predicted RNA binding protein with dsRBD fold (UPF0201 family)
LLVNEIKEVKDYPYNPSISHLQSAFRDLSNENVRNDRGVYQMLSDNTPAIILKFSNNIESIKDLTYLKEVFSQGTTSLRDMTSTISPDSLLLALQKCILISRKSLSRICNDFEIDTREVSLKMHIPSKERKVILDMFYKDNITKLFNEGVSEEAKNTRLQEIVEQYDIGNLINVIKKANNSVEIMSNQILLRRVSILIGNVIMSSLNKLFEETNTISASSLNEEAKIDSVKKERNQYLYDIMVEMNNVFDSLEIDFERVRMKIENLREKKKQDQLQKLRGITPEMMELYNVFKRTNLEIGENQLEVFEEEENPLNNMEELLSVNNILDAIREEAGTDLSIDFDIDNNDNDNPGSEHY